MAEDKLGMAPAVHRKELEKRIAKLEKKNNIITDKVNQMCVRFGICKL